MPPLMVEQVSYHHPDAVALTATVQQLYVQMYGGADHNPASPADFAPPAGGFLVGYAAGVVAMGGWRFSGSCPIPARRPAEIRRMFVAEAVRGRGYGRTVLAALEREAAAAGADVMILETGQPQVDAIGLYRTAGYVDVPTFGHYAGSDLAVHLGKPLLDVKA